MGGRAVHFGKQTIFLATDTTVGYKVLFYFIQRIITFVRLYP